MSGNLLTINMNDKLDMFDDDFDDEEFIENGNICFIDFEKYIDNKKHILGKNKTNNNKKLKCSPKGKEASYIKKVLKNFDYKTSIVWKKIQQLFSTGVRHTELISVAQILIQISGAPEVSRSCHRSFPVLIKWFDDNWDKIEPFIHHISLLDENMNTINITREMFDQIKSK